MRSRSLLATLSLVSGGLAALVVTTAPTSSASATLEQRWCAGPGTARPCVMSFRHNGVDTSPADTFRVRLNTPQALDGGHYVNWAVVRANGVSDLPPGDTWSVTIDTGTLAPRYTEGYSGDTWVERTVNGDGTYRVTISGRSVRTAEGCTDVWPPVCQDPAPRSTVGGAFNGEVWDLEGEGGAASWRNGYDRSQNVDGVNDPDFAPTSGGGYRFSTETYNSATYDDDGDPATAPVVFTGELRFRLPYGLMQKRFGVPDPDTLPLSSLTGSTSGSGDANPWTITRNAAGKYFLAEVTGITYPDTVSARALARGASRTQVRTLQVERGRITPYAPRNVSARRVAAHRGRVAYSAARARGARPTGYTVRCVVVRGTHVVAVNDAASPTAVTGLRSRRAYDCRVRARSKAGPGAWSVKVRVRARP
ncbi:fibronectin type III domain-containing protein [Nocardioides marmoribigeumensis]|uniref:Fibronectin type-III domain-containing protein n=1 Tax=Nocardioides marmoribigeumensis TaxID=433649 RepID=A0ABU2BWW6_9ACTN|nr:fibronectin type III domain-containing protein [Nocardioides marmoribigeumensis]MDR7362758.1 hypothetical protein [Nocardioides marmoribigeumensis]